MIDIYSGYKWADPVVTYSIDFSVAWRTEAIERWVVMWDEVIGAEFVRVSTDADMHFDLTPIGHQLADRMGFAEIYAAAGRIFQTTVYLQNFAEDWVIGHEIGHALGLDHPFERGYGAEGANTHLTIMDYFPAGRGPGTLLPADRFSLQGTEDAPRYGPNEILRGKDLFGIEGADTLIGSGGDDWIYGMKGPDVLLGGGGNDILRGGKGHDSIMGGVGDDTMYGGLGNDSFVMSPGNNVVMDFGNGDDYITGEIVRAEMTDDGVKLIGVTGTMLLMGYFDWPMA